MLKVVCFGEALVDLLSDRISGNDGAGEMEQFRKFPGGAPANAAVAVAKLGGEAYFAGMLGDDLFGRFLLEELKAQGVKTDYVRFTDVAKTALAFVSLDEYGERSFEFYRPPAADLCFRPAHFHEQTFAGQGILHLCSNSLTDSEIAETTMHAAELAQARGWLVSVDVNLRHNLWLAGAADSARVLELVQRADIVKMSREERDYLAASENFNDELLAQRPQLLLITDGPQPLHWITSTGQGQIQPPMTRAVDTTAAGDGFIGGLIYQLARQQVTPANLGEWLNAETLIEALSFACACGAHAASLPGAFPSLPSQQSLNAFLQARSQHV
ncbi:carbohydrate kinase family protein [Microbulbifer guangxiensis]|uniref:carbohydrate kinase family protein n=1 Tax=Microbulbifer guangxiensis TaxID=2904249 RepID=UPI001F1E6683|nr:carbohydrate kinase [Microbulbifer guangxiensis]